MTQEFTLSKKNSDQLYQGYLEEVYQHTHGYQAYTSQEKTDFEQSQVCITYGELLYPSVQKILNYLSLTEEDIFLDLGGGLGKCALQVFMQSNVKKVIAIEASTVLYNQAYIAKSKLKGDFPFFWEEHRELQLYCANFLQSDWQGATVVYSCSTCFTQELLVSIGNKINEYPHIQQVVSLRPLPTIGLPLYKIFGVECSWDSTLCYYYKN